ncbi:MAG: NAD(+)/NADH kinase [Gemmataceae bacterium]|nr:NAD(+)/NADH kinase [Gemmataceae bacterium]
MKILILGNAQRAGVQETVDRLLPWLRAQATILAVDLRQELDLAAGPGAEIALVFGGDGAILRAARQMAYRQVPVLGVNLGRLGFLADIRPEEVPAAFAEVLRGNFRVTRHIMFECVVEEDDRAKEAAPAQRPVLGGRTFLGLNEVVIHTVPPFHAVDLELEVNGAAVARFSGDGLIISTPIGSTAHNLSAGGPILAQELSAFVITPICAHTLTYRPLVESAEKTHIVRIGERQEQALVIVDGQETVPLVAGQKAVVRKAPVTFGLVKVPGRSYYQTLRDKLRWGMQPGGRGEP